MKHRTVLSTTCLLALLTVSSTSRLRRTIHEHSMIDTADVSPETEA